VVAEALFRLKAKVYTLPCGNQENQLVEFDSRSGETVDPKSWVRTDVILLEKKQGDFEYITGVIDPEGNEPLPVADLVKSKIGSSRVLVELGETD